MADDVEDPRRDPIHDLGGRSGFGPVPYVVDEAPFHDDWERRVFGLLGAVGPVLPRPGQFRYVLERLAADDYFDHGYYGRWEAAFEVALEEEGVIGAGAVDARLGAAEGTGPSGRARPMVTRRTSDLPPQSTAEPVRRGSPLRLVEAPPLYEVGQRVVARRGQPGTHTRLPEYAIGHVGVIDKIHPAEVFPDSSAHDLGERPQHVYCVAYDASEVWGADAEPGVRCFVDLYEPYLTPAEDQ